MTDKLSVENAARLLTELSPQEQLKLVALIGERLSKALPPGDSQQANITELQRMEAEWVSRELDEFVKLIQQYRSLYLGAIFIAVGWVLGQAVGGGGGATSSATGTTPATLESFRYRQDVAAVLCIVPLLSVFFAAIVAEAYAHMKSLARYRFILGFALGGGTPAWRWERWRDTSEGSTRSWTSPLNVLSVFILLIFTAGALIFPFPAVWNSSSWWLWSLWVLALSLSLALVIVLVVLGRRNQHRNAVADSPTLHWSDLEMSEDGAVSARQANETGVRPPVVQQQPEAHATPREEHPRQDSERGQVGSHGGRPTEKVRDKD
jgi:hypothetical protein